MPIYEYRCEECGRITSTLVLSKLEDRRRKSGEKMKDEQEARCSHCGGGRLIRILSRVSVHKTESQRLKEFNTGAPRDESFYRDSRNVGLWAKKRAQELGTDLGPQLDETIEKARSGKILEDYDV